MLKKGKTKTLIDSVLKEGVSKLTKVGDVVEGVVLGKEGSKMYVDLGPYGTGIVYGREFYEAQDIIKSVNVGDVISGKVVETENEDGYVELSLREAGYDKAWDDLEEKMRLKEVLEVKILEANKGGLVANINGIPAFMPVSQLLANHYPRVEGGDKTKILQELSKYVGETFTVRIIDVDRRENKLIISEKAAQDDDLQKILNSINVGDVIEGEVSGVVDFGAFIKFHPNVEGVKVKEIEGLVHISELDWQLIEDPSDIVKVGDKVKAKVISKDGGKISLSIKALKKDPWEDIDKKYKVGDVVEGVVTKINPFGAFVKLDENIHGLCHVSEFESEDKMRSTLKENEKYKFYIQSIVKNEHRMALGFGDKPKQKEPEEKKTQDSK